MKRICALAAAVLLCLSAAGALAVSYTKSQTMMLVRGLSASLTVKGTTERIHRSRIRVSRPNVAQLSSVTVNTSTVQDLSTGKTVTNEGSNTLAFSIRGAGTATVAFEYQDTTYRATLRVLPWSNPVSSLRIPGVSSGANLKSRTASGNSANGLKLTKDTSNASIVLKTVSGSTLKKMTLRDLTAGETRSVTGGTMTVPKLYKSHSYKLTAIVTPAGCTRSVTLTWQINY